MLRILIARDRPSAGGGIVNYYQAIGVHLKLLVRYSDIGHPHSYYGHLSTKEKIFARIPIIRLCNDWLLFLVKILCFRPNVVVLNTGMDYKTKRALRRDAINARIAKLFGKQLIIFWRGWLNDACGLPQFPTGQNGWIHRSFRRADTHIVLASSFKEDLVRWGFRTPIHLETTVVSENASTIKPPAKKSSQGETGKRLLFLSRIEIAKGVYELVDAFEILVHHDPTYSLTIAGDGPELESLKLYCLERQIEQVTFPGFLSGDKKFSAFDNADIFCFLSYTEGMPNAVLEAMARGLPIVSSNAGGLKDILTEGVTGNIITQIANGAERRRFSTAMIVDAIRSLSENPRHRKNISEHNRSFANDKFSATAVAQRFEAIVKNLATQFDRERNSQ